MSTFPKIDVHMHYGGTFKEEPRIWYTSEKVAIFERFDLVHMNIPLLHDMYKKVINMDTVGNIKLWYKIPCLGLDVGVAPIEYVSDIDLLCNSYKGLDEMHIYIEEGEKLLTIMSPKEKEDVVQERGDIESGAKAGKYKEDRGSNGGNKDLNYQNKEYGGEPSKGLGEGLNRELHDFEGLSDIKVGDKNVVVGKAKGLNGCESESLGKYKRFTESESEAQGFGEDQCGSNIAYERLVVGKGEGKNQCESGVQEVVGHERESNNWILSDKLQSHIESPVCWDWGNYSTEDVQHEAKLKENSESNPCLVTVKQKKGKNTCRKES